MRSASVSNLAQEPLTLLSWVEGGEEVEICRDGVPVARVLPISPYPAGKPSTPEEIEHYLRHRPAPAGPVSEETGAALVSWGRGEI